MNQSQNTIVIHPKNQQVNDAPVSADCRQTMLHTIALLFLSISLAAFSLMSATQLPIVAFSKAIVIVIFNLFAGYMLFDAFSELYKLICSC